MTNINLVCPNLQCKAALEVNESMRGQRVRCLKCGQMILVPARKSPPPDKRR